LIAAVGHGLALSNSIAAVGHGLALSNSFGAFRSLAAQVLGGDGAKIDQKSIQNQLKF